MRLNELFDSVYSWKWIRHNEYDAAASFKDDAGEYIFVMFGLEDNNMWEVEFERTHKYPFYQTSVTGEGEAFTIFSTVITVMEDFVEQYRPKSLTFTADTDEPSRVKLYNVMINKFAKSKDFNVEIMPNVEAGWSRYIMHTGDKNEN